MSERLVTEADLKAADTADRAEAERLRTGLRRLIRDWAEGWEDCTPFDQREAYVTLIQLLGPDYNSERTWIAPRPGFGDLS